MPITWVKVPKYKCRTCGHEWFPRNPAKPGKPPKQCPKCHNAYWNEPRVIKRGEKLEREEEGSEDNNQ